MKRVTKCFLALSVAVGGQKIAAVDDVLYFLTPYSEVNNAAVDAFGAEIVFVVLIFFIRIIIAAFRKHRAVLEISRNEVTAFRAV